jgi:hypothetical protein
MQRPFKPGKNRQYFDRDNQLAAQTSAVYSMGTLPYYPPAQGRAPAAKLDHSRESAERPSAVPDRLIGAT